jgi:hypothetical protein
MIKTLVDWIAVRSPAPAAIAHDPPCPSTPQLDLTSCSIWPQETVLMKQLVEQTSSFFGPIVEIGTLVGLTTTKMALWDRAERTIITVDNYSWNPWGLSPEDHRAMAGHILHYLSAMGRVEIVADDKNEFYRTYRGPAPSLVFLDAIHDYPQTKIDIQWAKEAGARMIAGHDYIDKFPGVIKAVDEAGGPDRLCGSLWTLRD